MQVIGTKKRPVYNIEEEMWFSPECKIRFAQLSENGLWIYFYADSETPIFEFPAIFVDSMRKFWLEEKDGE